MSVSKAIILGRIGKDIELKHSKNGDAYAQISIATTDYKKNTHWHWVSIFGKQAEIVAQYCTKGDQLFVECSLGYSEYNEKKKTDLVVRDFALLGNKKDKEEKKAPTEEDFDF